MDYKTIKQAASKLGISYRELIALAPQNDPFYVGTPKDEAQAQWFANIWQKAGYISGVHLRRIHYWCVSQGVLPMHDGRYYENSDKCWKYLSQAAKVARYLGLVRIADIADNKHPSPTVYADYRWPEPDYGIEAPDLTEPEVTVYGIKDSMAQPYHLEVWCEKSTMNDVLLPVCHDYGANLATFEGEVSITACYDLIQRLQEAGSKPARIFYISDFDPAGQSMPVATARKIEFMLQRYGLDIDVRLTPIVLTQGQVKRYRLPRTPIKESERRAGAFEDVYGAGAVELDALEALHPGELRRIVSKSLARYYSKEAQALVFRRRRELRQAVTQKVSAITDRYQDEIAVIQAMIDELNSIEIIADDYAVATFKPHVNENGRWLFTSTRDYVAQIDAYKIFKNGGHLPQ